MIFETDEETRDFLTIYKKDYRPKRGSKKLDKFVQPSNYEPPLNALNGPYHEHLNSRLKNERVSSENRTEDLGDNLQRLRSRYRHLTKILPDTPPNEKTIEEDQKKAFKTNYQLQYSTHLDDYLSLHAKRTGSDRPPVTLPRGWIIPETVQKSSFRDNRDSGSSFIHERSLKLKKPSNNLDPNDNEREILQVRTGNTEYADVIGATGDRVMKQRLHGVSLFPDALSPRPEEPGSVTSNCSAALLPRRQDDNILKKSLESTDSP